MLRQCVWVRLVVRQVTQYNFDGVSVRVVLQRLVDFDGFGQNASLGDDGAVRMFLNRSPTGSV